MEIEISKVALSYDMFMKVSFIEKLPDNDERKHPNVSCSAPVHADLTAAFKLFTPHFALICERITKEEFIESIPAEYDSTVGYSESGEMGEYVAKALASKSKKLKAKNPGLNGTDAKEVLPTDIFRLNAVEFKYVNGADNVRISGEIQLSTTEWIPIGPCPWIDINGEYQFKDDLFQLAQLLKYEVGEYVINHKYAPPVDPEFDFGNGPETNDADQQY